MNKLLKWNLAGAAVTVFAGVLLHFIYAWSGECAAVGLFSAVNESTWEHLKLLFVPMLAFSVAEYFVYGREMPDFITVKALSMLAGMGTIIVLFYTYSGVIGRNYLLMDILTFVIGVAAAYALSFFKLNYGGDYGTAADIAAGAAIIVMLILMFAFFTFWPPEIGLFLDPVSGRYGA